MKNRPDNVLKYQIFSMFDRNYSPFGSNCLSLMKMVDDWSNSYFTPFDVFKKNLKW